MSIMEEIKYYNIETKELSLVKDVDMKNKEVKTETYQYPFFVQGIYTKKAIELGVELEESEYMVNANLFDKLASFFVDLYGKQFTKTELTNGIDSRKVIETFIQILFGVLQGDTSKNE